MDETYGASTELQRTLLFTDIEGSSASWETKPQQMAEVLSWYESQLTRIILSHGGCVFKQLGERLCAIFEIPFAAVQTASEIQRHLLAEGEKSAQGVRVRIAIHSGPVYQRLNDYFGETLTHNLRLLSLCHGGQTIISATTHNLVCDDAANFEFVDLGQYRLKAGPPEENIYQLNAEGISTLFPPIHAPSRGKSNLPQPLTSFVGKAEEMQNIVAFLTHGRLVTLLGAGGIGKTRLAIESATRGSDRFPSGTWFVPLDAISDPKLVPQEVAGLFGFKDSQASTAKEKLIEYLQDQEMLLVIDNCEHLVQSVAHLAAEILSKCSGVTLLATSREVLGVPGEIVVRVKPLTTPQVSKLAAFADLEESSDIKSFEAVRLFVERAIYANPQFRITGGNMEALCKIAERLEGIPLAIELAAARCRMLSLEQILERLDNAFAVLSAAKTIGAARQQTLRATIDWSYNLLSESERILFRRLAPFHGTFSLDATESVGSLSPLSKEDVLNILSQLIDKSLVQTEEISGLVRYRMLETVRQFAGELLSKSDESTTVLGRHLDYFADLGVKADIGLRSKDQVRWRRSFDLEMDNVRAALDWALAEGDGWESAARLAWRIFYYWFEWGHFTEAKDYYDRIRKLAGNQSDTELNLRATVFSGALDVYLGDRSGIETLEEALEMARKNHAGLVPFVIEWLGDAHYVFGEDDPALKYLYEALEIAQSTGRTKAEQFLRASIALIAANQSNFSLAESQLNQMLENKKNERDVKGIGLVHLSFGHSYFLQNRPEANEHFRTGIALVAIGPDYYLLGGNLPTASLILLEQGDPSAAAKIQGYADRILECTAATPDRLFQRTGQIVRQRTKELLTPAQYQACWKEGRTLTLEEALAILGCEGISMDTVIGQRKDLIP